MPKTIDITIIWDDWSHGCSVYSMGRHEIENIIENYGLGHNQPILFSYFSLSEIKRWIWDVFAREPYEIVVESITY